MNRKKLLRDTHSLRRIAVEAVVDDRTVARLLRGERVLNSSRIRIEGALNRLGFIKQATPQAPDGDKTPLMPRDSQG